MLVRRAQKFESDPTQKLHKYSLPYSLPPRAFNIKRGGRGIGEREI